MGFKDLVILGYTMANYMENKTAYREFNFLSLTQHFLIRISKSKLLKYIQIFEVLVPIC